MPRICISKISFCNFCYIQCCFVKLRCYMSSMCNLNWACWIQRIFHLGTIPGPSTAYLGDQKTRTTVPHSLPHALGLFKTSFFLFCVVSSSIPQQYPGTSHASPRKYCKRHILRQKNKIRRSLHLQFQYTPTFCGVPHYCDIKQWRDDVLVRLAITWWAVPDDRHVMAHVT